MQTPVLLPHPRRYDLDWLRVLAFMLLIFYHTGMFFVSWDWHVKNQFISEALETPMLFLSQWRMSLLFLISGAGVYFALGRRSSGRFLTDRHKRLLLPLLFGMLVIVPPQIYFERLQRGEDVGSYLHYYPRVFEFQPYPEGNFSWHHLWYLAYILVYSLLTLPLFRYLRSDAGSRQLQRLTRFLARPLPLFLFVLPLWMGDALLRPYWETTHNLLADWANFTFSLLMFIYGFVLCADGKFAEVIQQIYQRTLAMGLVTVTALYTFYWIDWPDPSPTGLVFYRLLKDLNIWCWLLTILGFARRYLSFSNPLLKYAGDAVYPFYIMHQTIIVALGYFMATLPMGVGVKFLVISLTTFGVCAILYEFIIRRVPVLRPLFGLRYQTRLVPKKSEEPVYEQTSA
jgi:surface polysaccharide O-acyltransferase-like enzyme